MKDPSKQIDDLSAFVNLYYKCDRNDGDQLSYLLQKITGILFFLETVRSEVHDMYETKVFELVKEGNSVARAVNEANVTYPQMYQLRHIMSSGYKIADAIRTNISYLKSEKQHTT